MSARPATSTSIVAPSRGSRRMAAAIVIAYALLSMVPLVWILLTSFKTPHDSISYPPKVLFEPSLEGYCNLFTTRTRCSGRRRCRATMSCSMCGACPEW